MTQSSPEAFAFLQPGDPFPEYGQVSEALGPLAIGGDLSPETLHAAYSRGIFPWYSNPPILWWSPDPRMVLPTAEFRLHRSMRKTVERFRLNQRCEIRVDSAFGTILQHCANIYRAGQNGTWINTQMQQAYRQFHEAGHAHSVETWVNGELRGGLYFINIGKAVFGESMFSLQPDASKLAIAALVCLCRKHGISHIDCQQNTSHLTSLGGKEITRHEFLEWLAQATRQDQPTSAQWQFSPADWLHLLEHQPASQGENSS